MHTSSSKPVQQEARPTVSVPPPTPASHLPQFRPVAAAPQRPPHQRPPQQARPLAIRPPPPPQPPTLPPTQALVIPRPTPLVAPPPHLLAPGPPPIKPQPMPISHPPHPQQQQQQQQPRPQQQQPQPQQAQLFPHVVPVSQLSGMPATAAAAAATAPPIAPAIAPPPVQRAQTPRAASKNAAVIASRRPAPNSAPASSSRSSTSSHSSVKIQPALATVTPIPTMAAVTPSGVARPRQLSAPPSSSSPQQPAVPQFTTTTMPPPPPITTSSTTTAMQTPPFLTKLYQLVEDPDTVELVSWTDEHGLSFTVHKPSDFGRDILPKYFKHNNFSSFVRQLNQYGFHKLNPDRWMFGHDNFRKDRPDLLRNITRRRPKQNNAGASGGISQAVVPPHGLGGPNNRAVVELGNYGLDGEVQALKRDKDVLYKELVVTRQAEETLKNRVDSLENRMQNLEHSNKQMQAFIMHYFSQVLQPYSQAVASRKRKRLPASTSPDDVMQISQEKDHAAAGTIAQVAQAAAASNPHSIDSLRVMMQQMGVNMSRGTAAPRPRPSAQPLAIENGEAGADGPGAASELRAASFPPATIQELPEQSAEEVVEHGDDVRVQSPPSDVDAMVTVNDDVNGDANEAGVSFSFLDDLPSTPTSGLTMDAIEHALEEPSPRGRGTLHIDATTLEPVSTSRTAVTRNAVQHSNNDITTSTNRRRYGNDSMIANAVASTAMGDTSSPSLGQPIATMNMSPSNSAAVATIAAAAAVGTECNPTTPNSSGGGRTTRNQATCDKSDADERAIEKFLELDDVPLPPPLMHLPEGTDIQALAQRIESFADQSNDDG